MTDASGIPLASLTVLPALTKAVSATFGVESMPLVQLSLLPDGLSLAKAHYDLDSSVFDSGSKAGLAPRFHVFASDIPAPRGYTLDKVEEILHGASDSDKIILLRATVDLFTERLHSTARGTFEEFTSLAYAISDLTRTNLYLSMPAHEAHGETLERCISQCLPRKFKGVFRALHEWYRPARSEVTLQDRKFTRMGRGQDVKQRAFESGHDALEAVSRIKEWLAQMSAAGMLPAKKRAAIEKALKLDQS